MENAKKFFEEILLTDEAKKVLQFYEPPKSIEEVKKAYSDIAKKFGIDLTPDEVGEYIDEKSRFAENAELDDDEVVHFSGGADHADCLDTFKDKENCWWIDACDYMAYMYDDYLCSWSSKGICQLLSETSTPSNGNGKKFG